jgi:hypothetical protein
MSGEFSNPSGLPFPTVIPEGLKVATPSETPMSEPESDDHLREDAKPVEEVKPTSEEVTFTSLELDKFWDAVLKNEPYIEEISVGKAPRTLNFVFKTRGTSEFNEIQELLEARSINLQKHWDILNQQYLLASSLYSFNGKKLPSEPEKQGEVVIRSAVERRLQFVEGLPQSMVARLLRKLGWFEEKVSKMQEEVFSENF